jgi:hypothetical protein
MLLALSFLAGTVSIAGAAAASPADSHGIGYPVGWQEWAAIAVSHRTDNETMRVVLGNDVAVRAARSGRTNPWPDGAILGKVVWKGAELENWQAARAPGQFVHAEFMFKDAQRYPASGGWGWARWVGLEQQPFNDGAEACVACHTPVKHRDWVFTEPAVFPPMERDR